MIDICFVGNSSIDDIKCSSGRKRVFGGSCIYSALSCRNSTDKKIAIISNVNNELNAVLKSNKIDVIGNILENINSFEIDESNNTCIFVKKKDVPIIIDEILNIKHLHVSFRKGVDIENILDNPNINYESLSADVMIHSVGDFIPYLVKYKNKITTLFCNAKEYTKIKKYIQIIPNIIITNEDKPIVLMENGKNYSYSTIAVQSIVSTTGAGDSFIGGFLAKQAESKSISVCVFEGIKNSAISIGNFGPILLTSKINKKGIESNVIPNNIIVIGNSCAGKSTFIDFLKKIYNIYTDIDDLPPLLETFELDDISSKGNLDDLKTLKSKIVYMKDLYDEYIQTFPNISHYSIMAENGQGHDIINPILWDMILEKAVTFAKEQNNIIQFSRGKDEDYERQFGNNVYERSLQSIIKKLPNKEETIIINLCSDLKTRKTRNRIRYENGGHFVSDETMDNVYSDDIFDYEHIDSNRGFIILNGESYPVFTIFNDKTLSNIELNQFMLYNLNEIINYFNESRKGDTNEFKRNSKRYLEKQGK